MIEDQGPQLLPPLFDDIPAEIKAHPQWVMWKAIKREGKVTKPPFMPNGEYAKANAPETWSSFTTCRLAYKGKIHGFDGVGYVLTEDDPFVGIDLDKCRCPAFDLILPWAQVIIDEIDSYTEASPSGKGIRIFASGAPLPPNGRKKGSVEVYDSGRYLTVTGNHIPGTPKNIQNRSEKVLSFHERYFGSIQESIAPTLTVQSGTDLDISERLQKAFSSENGEKVKRLFEGDKSGYPSQSEADIALCSYLAFWLNRDPSMIDQAFRRSGLMRQKWDETHFADGQTYGKSVITKAISSCGESYTERIEPTQPIQSTEAWPEPLPLPDRLLPVKSLEPGMIPVPLRGWLLDIADRMQIPPDFSTAAAIVTLGAIIGRGCGIYPKRLDDWLVIPNLWGAVVGRPSLMKTPAISEAQHPLNRLESEARYAYQRELEAFEIDKEIMKLTKATVTEEIKQALKVGTDIKVARKKLAELQMYEPIRRRFQTQDSTVEKIGELLNQNPRGLLINRDELIGWLRSLDRDGREGDRAFYLEAWNGNRSFTCDRIGRGTLDIGAICISIFGAITPGQLSGYVYQANRGGNGDDGLLQRFQVVVWPDSPVEWKNVDRFPDSKEKNRAWEISKALSGEIPGTTIEDYTVSVPALHFSPGGQGVFDVWREDLENRLRSDHGLHPAMESHLTKYRKLMPSLALIFHLIAVADGANPSPVSEDAALMAVAWCDYLGSHACRIYGAATMPKMEAAREIIRHIRRGEIKDGFTPKEIYRKHWSRLTTPEELRAGLEVLEEYEWLTIRKISTGGRPSEIIILNPRINIKSEDS